MFTIILEKNGKPLYEQIYQFIRKEIEQGQLNHYEKLPSKRKLAAHLSVSVNTVDTAYSQLVAEGYIEAKEKAGFFVCPLDTYSFEVKQLAEPKKETENPHHIDIVFSVSNIDEELFPFHSFRKIFKSVFNEFDTDYFKKPNIQGDEELRKELVKILHQSRGVNCRAEQIVIGAGTDSLLQMVSMLIGKNQKVAFENPVYLKAYKMFENMGHDVVAVDIDEKGIQTERLEQIGSAVVYVTPSHHFPLGISMPIDRRIKLLNYANQFEDAFLIEDDYDSEFRYNEKPLPSLQSIDRNGKVIYIGTFSKSIAPSVRVSYMVLPEQLIENFRHQCHDWSSAVSVLEQKMITAFIQKGDFEKHIHRARKIYKEKRLFLLQELSVYEKEIKISGENAGHHLLIHLLTGLSESDMVSTAAKEGIGVYPISPYFIDREQTQFKSKVMMGYGALKKKEISEGVKRLAKAWQLKSE